MPESPRVTRRRWRVSLLSLVLITTCVAMVLGLLRSAQRAEAFRLEMSRTLEENRRLRKEYGEFEVTDPSLLYAVRMHPDTGTEGNRDWAWRVATPAGKRSVLKYADGLIGVPTEYNGLVSKRNLPKPAYQEILEPGRHTIRLGFEYDPRFPAGKAWQWRLAIRSELDESRQTRSTSRSMAASAWPSLVDDDGPLVALFQPSEGLDWGTSYPVAEDAYASDKPLILQRMRVQTIDRKLVPLGGFPTYDDIPGFDRDADAPGFVIWLEPQP